MTKRRTTPASWGRRIEAARDAADDERLNIGFAVGLLAMLGEYIGEPGRCPDDMECQELGSRVDYLARQIGRHGDDLAAELEKIEKAAMALGGLGAEQDADAEPESPGGNIVRLAPADGDAA